MSHKQLSAEEQEKRAKRRERNKVAAQKCRSKRRMKMESLEEVRTGFVLELGENYWKNNKDPHNV